MKSNRLAPKKSMRTLRWFVSLLLMSSFVSAAGPNADLAQGSFLVASRGLRDPNFAETVVLLVDYGRDGAMGLIVNWPTRMQLSQVLPEIEGLEGRDDRVFVGGPVAKWQMVLLVRSAAAPEDSRPVMDEVYFSSSRVLLESLAERQSDTVEFRTYVGHAGWAPGQLEAEVARGGWHILPGDAAVVFDPAPSEVWPDLIRQSSVQWAKLHSAGAGWRSVGYPLP
jgi:putative transcriptional regulator